ncbi:MAG: sialate O-acetylesterase [Bacteriovoracaceae bacterium]
MNNLIHTFNHTSVQYRNLSLCLVMIAASWNLSAQSSSLIVAPLFQDNMVLQQKSAVAFWGKGSPGTHISIKASWGKNAFATVLPDSSWMTKLNTPKAGGPFMVIISDGTSQQELRNVLTGEVWICSGQSNMDMPVEGWPVADSTANGLQQAYYPNIRIFNVPRALAADPQFNCNGRWQECSPKTVGQFSAVGYFFGKKLHQELKVPIGLIQASWGGTPVEAWTSGKHISQHPDYNNFSETFAKGKIENDTYMKWLESRTVVNVEEQRTNADWRLVNLFDSLISRKEYSDSSWKGMNLPTLWESAIGNYNGVLWFRKQVEIPQTWRNKELVLELGPIDDYDVTFVNSCKVGAIDTGSGWNKKRVYTIPVEITKDSLLTIAVRVIDVIGGGGIYGEQGDVQIHPKNSEEIISLAGEWKYSISAEFRNNKLYLFDNTTSELENRPAAGIELSSSVPTSLYNGMIAPLIPFSIRGALWYQGETNTGNPEAYKTLFPLMIKNWREDWKNMFPFYFVQLAPFQYGERTQSQRLREAQLQTLSVPKTGMAVTLDIGDSADVHPKDKQSVGERLARWALKNDYGKKVTVSGPLYTGSVTSGDTMVLSFKYSDGLTMKLHHDRTYFQIAGADSLFQEALVTVKKNKLFVYSADVKNPLAVRYGWGNVVYGTLFNKEGLPAPSFRTDDWKN